MLKKALNGKTFEEMHQLDMKIIHGMGFTNASMLRSYQLSRCAPFPGTEMYEQIKSAGDIKTIALLKDYRKHDGGQDTVMKALNE
jgi:hypothetical protein